MTQLEFLSKPKSVRMLISFGNFFAGLGLGIWHFIIGFPKKVWKLLKKVADPIYVLKDALLKGDWLTRANFLICGFAHFFRHQIVRGVLYVLYEGFFIFFMIVVGGPALAKLGTLGSIAKVTYYVETSGGIELEATALNDNSLTILLYSIVSIAFMLIFVYLWFSSIRDAKSLQDNEKVGKFSTNASFIHDLAGKNYHDVLLLIPMAGLAIFTIIPIIFMVIIGFTNYNSNHLTPTYLFDWVGGTNYASIFGGGTSQATDNTLFLRTFLQVLAWTLIWAFFATFSNYFLGMIVALMINQKGIKLKKVWRTILITTIAVPQFVSLLLIRRMLITDVGFVNQLLTNLGWITSNIKWLEDATLTKVVIIVINTWIGIPYTMLICTGILMNIPNDLYESARIDGASPFKMYMRITLPYMLFVTGPYLISQFVGNINNFNVIYLLSEGNPLFTYGASSDVRLTGLGQSDLLITWIYKMTVSNQSKDYATASVLGVMIFVIVAFFSLIFYGRSSAVKNEEDFQ